MTRSPNHWPAYDLLTIGHFGSPGICKWEELLTRMFKTSQMMENTGEAWIRVKSRCVDCRVCRNICMLRMCKIYENTSKPHLNSQGRSNISDKKGPESLRCRTTFVYGRKNQDQRNEQSLIATSSFFLFLSLWVKNFHQHVCQIKSSATKP